MTLAKNLCGKIKSPRTTWSYNYEDLHFSQFFNYLYKSFSKAEQVIAESNT